MRRPAAAVIAALLTASALAGCAIRQPVDLPDPQTFEAQLLDQINATRTSVGAPRLDSDACMAEHARERAAALPGAEEVPREDLPGDCGDFDYAGENVSRSELGPAEVVATWSEDDLQYPNLVDEGFTHAGVGCVGVSFDDMDRPADPGEELAGMACSVVFQGPGQAAAVG